MRKPDEPQTQPPDPRERERILDEINRRVLTFAGMHRKCREPICRRLRRCAGPDYRCQRDFPQPAMTEQEDAKFRADLHDAVKRDVARRQALRAEPLAHAANPDRKADAEPAEAGSSGGGRRRDRDGASAARRAATSACRAARARRRGGSP